MQRPNSTRRAPKVSWWAKALTALPLTLALLSCAADLEEPERFPLVPPCRDGIDVPSMLASRCAGAACHSPSESPAAGLDLISPNVHERLVRQPSTKCDGLLRIDPDDPDASFLLGKMLGPPAGCGDRMPIIGFVTENEIACVRSWIHEVATLPVPDASVPDASVPDASVPDASVPDAAGDGEVLDGSMDGGDGATTDGATMDGAAMDGAVGADDGAMDAASDGAMDGDV